MRREPEIENFSGFFCGSGVGGSGSWYLKAWFPSHRKPPFSGASYCWTNNLESNLELEIYSSFWWQSRGGVGWNSTAGPTLTIAILKMVLSQFSVAPGTWRTKDHVGTSVTSTDLLEQLYLEFFSLEQMDFFPKHGGSTLQGTFTCLETLRLEDASTWPALSSLQISIKDRQTHMRSGYLKAKKTFLKHLGFSHCEN